MRKAKKALGVASVALCAVLLASCAGKTQQAASSVETKTYTGSATGMDSVVTATLTMEGDKITNAEIDVSGETKGIGDAIGDEVAQQVLDA